MASNTLWFVKLQKPKSGNVEVYWANAKEGYADYPGYGVTPVKADDANDGIWTVDKGNAYFLKFRHTGTNSVEVHRLPGPAYSEFDLQSGSRFPADDAQYGTFTIDNGNLYYIRTRLISPKHDFIKVYMASAASKFQTLDEERVTKIRFRQDASDVYTIRGGDLYVIRTKNTREGRAEVHCVRRDSDGTPDEYMSWLPADAHNGIYDIASNGDLYFMKIKNTKGDKVEVFIATKSSNYRDIPPNTPYFTAFSIDDGPKGWWSIKDGGA